ncbi:MAG: OmpA family protein, partial [Candidatus Solibacter sp.]|nr:OmpA family protein [Candidatus Solibacter sp.]
MFRKRKFSIICLALALAMFAAGCKKKVPAPPPPPPPPPAPVAPAPRPVAPTVAQFTAEPTSIQRGQTSTLRWEVTGPVTSVSINQGVGTVQST